VKEQDQIASRQAHQPGSCIARVRGEVFIGGSGQSGVSILNALLSRHPLVLGCPLETCFIVAANGLMDVVRGVSDEYDPFRLDVILHEFERLMCHHLCSPRSYPYNRFDLASFFGPDRYRVAIDRFFGMLGVVRYRGDGLTVQSAVRIGGSHAPFKFKRFRFPAWAARERSYLYYAERQSSEGALTAASTLLDNLFGAKARDECKQVWCEQTSTNQQAAQFLHKLCPSGLFINLIRDPLDVALAHQAQDWSPDDFQMVCTALASLYHRWFETRAGLPSGSFLEERFEDLVSEPKPVLERVCAAIGIRYDPCMLEMPPDPERAEKELKRRIRADLPTYRRTLGGIAERLGYRVQ
jgi:hypothetical protein